METPYLDRMVKLVNKFKGKPKKIKALLARIASDGGWDLDVNQECTAFAAEAEETGVLKNEEVS